MHLIRLLIVGDTGVGKTSLLVRFNDDNFIKDQKTTIGVDYKAKEININDEIVKLQIWDTAGQERFRAMTSAFYSKAQGVVLVFDVNQRDTFQSLPTWIHDVKLLSPEYCEIILCANKVDFPLDQWRVKKEEYKLFADRNKLNIVESSAATGLNVDELFIGIGKQILTNHRDKLTEILETDLQNGSAAALFNIDDKNKGKTKKKKNCCS